MEVFKNSYVMMATTFICTYIMFYLLGIGYTATVVNNKVTKRVSWKGPAALALTVWLVWHFYLFPYEERKPIQMGGNEMSEIKKGMPKINMNNWV